MTEPTFKPDMARLVEAFDNNSGEGFLHYFLDRQSGEVLVVTAETLSAVEDGDDPSTIEGESPEELADALLVVNDTEDRYRVVEGEGSREPFKDMQDFTETVADRQLRYHLDTALNGNRPFRRFKDALVWDQAELDRWYAYRDAQQLERVRQWLRDEGLPDA